MAHPQCHCGGVVIIPFMILASGCIKQVLSVRADEEVKASVIGVDAADTFVTVSQTCIYGQEKCCCTESGQSSCKKFLTGQLKGEDACTCQDKAAMKLLGFSGVEPKSSEQEEVCAGINTTEGGTEEPAGSCNLVRLYELESQDRELCKHKTLEKLKPLQSKLDKSKLLNFDNRITGGAIMGCATLEKACAAAHGWSPSKVMKRIVDAGVEFTLEHMRRSIVRLGMYWSGVSWSDSGVMSKWAFTHGPANNPFCKDATKDATYTGKLHKVLMMQNDGSENNSSDYLISASKWSDALQAAIQSMLVVD